MANTEELESKLKEQEEMNHREKEEIARLRYELTLSKIPSTNRSFKAISLSPNAFSLRFVIWFAIFNKVSE
jgi:hypothetical protein